MKRYFSVVFLLVLVSFLASFLSACTLFQQPKGPRNASEHLNKPYVIMISIDGYRHDYTEKYNPPVISEFKKAGVRAQGLKSVYPSVTFPNHYAIATGLYTENHGLVANHFWRHDLGEEYSLRNREKVEDRRFYEGVPMWVAAEKQGMVAATFFWVGSEADVRGKRASYFYTYDGSISNRARMEQVVDWLKKPPKQRPHLITAYFSVVDSMGHRYGPDSDPVRESVLEVDQQLGFLFEGLKKLNLPINVILVSDHGMQEIDPVNKGVAIDEFASLENFRVYGPGPQSLLYVRETIPQDQRPEVIQETYKKIKAKEDPERFRVYLKQDIPEAYRFRNHPAVPDILVDAKRPYVVGPRATLERLPKGMHGFDPEEKEMWGFFYAKGPQLQENMDIDAFRNIHIYPLVMEILGLKVLEPIDGSLEVLKPILR